MDVSRNTAGAIAKRGNLNDVNWKAVAVMVSDTVGDIQYSSPKVVDSNPGDERA